MTDRRVNDIPYNKKIVSKLNRSWLAIDRVNSNVKYPLYCEILTDKQGHNYIWFKRNTYYF